jgi:putative PIN family toxin of toxin-antitoxin system
MGKKKEKVKKVVLDTSVLISALLFKGELSKLVELWQRGKIIPVISKDTFQELRSVLEYPKFSLSQEEINTIIENEVLPHFEVAEVTKEIKGVCRDSADDKFISCALSASAGYIVSGDRDLCALNRYKSAKIVTPSYFLKLVK